MRLLRNGEVVKMCQCYGKSFKWIRKLLLGNSVHTTCKYYTIDDFKSFNGVSFIHYNAKSLGANISRAGESLQRLSLTFDIVAISESWRKINYLHYQLPNYSLFYTDRSQVVIQNHRNIVFSWCYRVPRSDTSVFLMI